MINRVVFAVFSTRVGLVETLQLVLAGTADAGGTVPSTSTGSVLG